MMTQLVGAAGMAFAVGMASLLATVIVRSPYTQDNLAPMLRQDYDRTPLAAVGPADLPAILADVPPFAFPEPPSAAPAGQLVAALPGEVEPLAQDPEGGASDADLVAQEPQQITLQQFEFGFEPGRVDLRVGVPVEFTVVNEGQEYHGLWLPEFGIKENIRPFSSETFVFTPQEPGRFRYECADIACGTADEHAAMTGLLIVVEH